MLNVRLQTWVGVIYIRYDSIFLSLCKYSKSTMIKLAIQRKACLLFATYISFDRSRGMRRKILAPNDSIKFAHILPIAIQFSKPLLALWRVLFPFLALWRVLFPFGRYGRRKSTKISFTDLLAVLIPLSTFRFFLGRGSCLRISVSCM